MQVNLAAARTAWNSCGMASAASLPITVTRGAGDDSSWELAVASTSGPASPLVSRLAGFRESSATEVIRTEAAATTVTVIISFGEKLEVEPTRGDNRPFSSFVAGLQQGPALTRHPGTLQCLQIDLSPLAAFQLFGVPGHHLTDTVIDLDDVAPTLGSGRLGDQLASADDWGTRHSLAERALNRLATEGRPPDPLATWAWRRLARSNGNQRIADLVRESGVSHGHLARRFRQQLGVTPKTAASLFRFERAAALLAAGDIPPAEVAASCGYADQSHLTREVNRLAGTTPGALRDSTSP
jgi:AraC-like DNA-binding protein